MNPAIDRDFDAHLERVREFLRIPSVSAYDGDLRSTAVAVCELIEAAGGTAEIAEPGEKRPTVIGVIDGPGPTVLRYGMYDVQPPGAGWSCEPFAAEVDDGRIYARGAANSKAALAGSLLAFAGADSPCRQVLLITRRRWSRPYRRASSAARSAANCPIPPRSRPAVASTRAARSASSPATRSTRSSIPSASRPTRPPACCCAAILLPKAGRI